MKKLVLSLLIVAVTGCADMTPMQRKILYAGASVIVVGAIAKHEMESGKPATEPGKELAFPNPPVCGRMNGSGSC